MTAYGSVEKAVRAMRDGAHDFLEKPLDLARLRNLVASALRSRPTPRPAPSTWPGSRGRGSARLRGGLARDPRRLPHRAEGGPHERDGPRPGGERDGEGTRGEAVHRASPRSRGPFVKVNCAALSEGLLESELFGHARGSFTGAVADRAGRFEAANRGTLFLDEVGRSPSTRR